MFIKIRYINGRYRQDLIQDHKIVSQLRREAGISNHPWPEPPEAYDKLLCAASRHGLGLEMEEEQ